jgi:hypothetical protein
MPAGLLAMVEGPLRPCGGTGVGEASVIGADFVKHDAAGLDLLAAQAQAR